MRQISKFSHLFFKTLVLLHSFVTMEAFAQDESRSSIPWKVLVYMQADNDLAEYALQDLREISRGLSPNSRVKVLVHLDLPNQAPYTQGLKEFEVLPAISIQQSMEKSDQFSENGSSQQENLTSFLLRSNEKYPSERTMLVIWGHGEGWTYGSDDFGGVALDSSPESRLSPLDIRAALKELEGVTGRKMGILALDACLMQTIEVAFTFRESSEYFIGSAEVQDFKGLPYETIIQFMEGELVSLGRESSSDESYYLAKKIPKLFGESFEGESGSETMSSISAKQVEHVFMPSFSKAFTSINDFLDSSPHAIFSLKRELEETPFFLGNTRDLDFLLASLENYFQSPRSQEEAMALEAIREARQSLVSSILSMSYGQDYSQSSGRYFLGAFKAFGIWFPASREEYIQRLGTFENSDLYGNQSMEPYKRFLQRLYNSQLF